MLFFWVLFAIAATIGIGSYIGEGLNHPRVASIADVFVGPSPEAMHEEMKAAREREQWRAKFETLMYVGVITAVLMLIWNSIWHFAHWLGRGIERWWGSRA